MSLWRALLRWLGADPEALAQGRYISRRDERRLGEFRQAHPMPPPRSMAAPRVHYHEWAPSEACATDHRTLPERRGDPRTPGERRVNGVYRLVEPPTDRNQGGEL